MFARDSPHNQNVTFDFNDSFTSTFMGTIMRFYRFRKKKERHAAHSPRKRLAQRERLRCASDSSIFRHFSSL
jgi:hypothetical protein